MLPARNRTIFVLRRCVRLGTVALMVLITSGVGAAYWPVNPPAGNSPALRYVIPSRTSKTELIYNLRHDEPSHKAVKTSIQAGRRVVWMAVTAYCPCKKCCGPHAHGITASGYSVHYNGGKFVAADVDRLPFGTHLSIPGYHGGMMVPVIDTGNAIRGNRLDVYFPTHEMAMRWGVKYLPVTIEE